MRSLVSTTTVTKALIPSLPLARNLFAVGATLGPIVDGLHNQCLLQYQVAPIVVDWPVSTVTAATSSSAYYFEPHLFASSWVVPPLLGVAYIVLGWILPRLIQAAINVLTPTSNDSTSAVSFMSGLEPTTKGVSSSDDSLVDNQQEKATIGTSETTTSSVLLGVKAFAAVITTAAIIRLSEYLILHPEGQGLFSFNPSAFEGSDAAEQHLLILITMAIVQWAYLDGTLASLLAASLAAMLGPLSELPFVAAGVWTYWPQAGDIYLPLRDLVDWSLSSNSGMLGSWVQSIFGTEAQRYQSLALNSITGPCYFAVTMDAIALGRWLDAIETEDTKHVDTSNVDLAVSTSKGASSGNKENPW